MDKKVKYKGSLNVKGNLILRNTNVNKLPDGLCVGGDLDIRYTDVTELPEWLNVSGSILLEGTNVTKFPENMFVGGAIKGLCEDDMAIEGQYIKIGYNKKRVNEWEKWFENKRQKENAFNMIKHLASDKKNVKNG